MKEIIEQKNQFTLHNILDEMIVLNQGNKKYTMKHILNIINMKNIQRPCIINISNNINLKISAINNIFFDFELEELKGINIFRKPIIYNDSNEVKYEFISNEQLEMYLKKFRVPKFICLDEDIKDNVNFANLNIHRNCRYIIKDCFQYQIYDSVNYEKFFKSKPNYIKKSFINPFDFEKNFNYYFNIKENINTNEIFHIYDDNSQTRAYIGIDLITMKQRKNIYNYYGASGQGKSVTVIWALKFLINFSTLGSLYINCKTIRNLLRDLKDLTVRQLLIDEIIFLNPYDYDAYSKSVNYIQNFRFVNEFSYWELIINILNSYCFNNNQYIIAFDQYNNEQDPYKKLNEIKNKYNSNNNLKFIILSSMNEKDIRKMKIGKLFDNEYESTIEDYTEFNNICRIVDLELSDEQRKVLSKIGNSFKKLIEIKNSKDLTKYVENQKLKYSLKIISFYLEDKQKEMFVRNGKISYIPEEIIGKILNFKIGYKYDKRTLISIIDNIPFRFYDFIKRDNLYYEIKFGFPLIEDVMTDIYKLIVLTKSYSAIKTILKNKGSGLGTIFELNVINHLLPAITGPTKIFDNFTITDKFKIHTIIQRDNEKNQILERYILQKNICYLVEQDIFNGKDVDCLIIEMRGGIPYIYAIQISIYKDTIFTKTYLQKSFINMINNLETIFSIKIDYDKVFFCYIFDYSRVGGKEYNEMLRECLKSGWKYFFYDCEKKIFCDKNNKIINDIKNNTTCPLHNIKKNNRNIINSILNYFNVDRIKPELLTKIEKSIAKERNKHSIKLKYLYEKNGPIADKSKVNIQFLPLGIEYIFLNNQELVAKILEIETGDIYKSNSINFGKYHIYEIN